MYLYKSNINNNLDHPTTISCGLVIKRLVVIGIMPYIIYRELRETLKKGKENENDLLVNQRKRSFGSFGLQHNDLGIDFGYYE